MKNAFDTVYITIKFKFNDQINYKKIKKTVAARKVKVMEENQKTWKKDKVEEAREKQQQQLKEE